MHLIIRQNNNFFLEEYVQDPHGANSNSVVNHVETFYIFTLVPMFILFLFYLLPLITFTMIHYNKKR